MVSLIDAGCDPGPVHIHGLTRQRLAGAPRYADVLPQLYDILDGRVMVAHNASFDYGFLAAEASRAGTTLPTRHRLCTLALSRRLGVPVPNHKLGTLAAHWNVRHRNAHDSLDDAAALIGVFAHSVDLAYRLGLPLPVVGCDGRAGRAGRAGRSAFPTRIVKTPCGWRCPGPLSPAGPLVQGMKVVITGGTVVPREELIARLVAAGMDVCPSVSPVTGLLVCNDVGLRTARPREPGSRGHRSSGSGSLRVLLAEEAKGRDAATQRMRRKASGFPTGKTFESWPEQDSSIEPATQSALRTLEWVGRAENLSVSGPSGTGKSHFVEARAHAIIDADMRVSWFTLETLTAAIGRARVNASISKVVAQGLPQRSAEHDPPGA